MAEAWVLQQSVENEATEATGLGEVGGSLT